MATHAADWKVHVENKKLLGMYVTRVHKGGGFRLLGCSYASESDHVTTVLHPYTGPASTAGPIQGGKIKKINKKKK